MRKRLLQALPVTTVLIMVAVGLVVVAVDEWRAGSLVLAAAAGLGAVLRLVLPTAAAGVLAVRSRAFDAVVFLLLAALLAGMALISVTPHV